MHFFAMIFATLPLVIMACSAEVQAPLPEIAETPSQEKQVVVNKSGSLQTSNQTTEADGTMAASEGGKVLGSQDVPEKTVIYPSIGLRGKGTTLCDNKTYDTTAAARSRLTDTLFNTELERATVVTRFAQGRVQSELDKNVSSVEYSLVPVADRSKVTGKDIAIFATSSRQAKKGTRFNFSEPLPVYIWPAPAARFEELRKKNSMSWTAKASGYRDLVATVTLTYVKVEGSEVTIRLDTSLSFPDGSPDPKGELYEDFPIPKSAEITFDGDRKVVLKSKNENWFYGDKYCDEKLGIVKIDYQACTKSIGGKTEDLGCSL